MPTLRGIARSKLQEPQEISRRGCRGRIEFRSMNYVERIQSAVDFIEDNLEGDISLESVSAHVGLSAFHFHRIFAAVLGESVTEYIRKRRLSEGARELVGGDMPIMEIALSCRFDSQESFTRAFKKMFGTTPGQYRSVGKDKPIPHKRRTSLEMMTHIAKGITMEPKIVTREEEHVIGMGGGFAEGATAAIHSLWEEFLTRKHEIKNVKEGYALGVCAAQHPDIGKRDGDAFTYIAGLPVTSLDDIPPGMVATKLLASRYAVFTHKGPLADLPHTISYIWGTWVPKGECKRREIADFELYDDRFDPESESSEFDIYVPIE